MISKKADYRSLMNAEYDYITHLANNKPYETSKKLLKYICIY